MFTWNTYYFTPSGKDGSADEGCKNWLVFVFWMLPFLWVCHFCVLILDCALCIFLVWFKCQNMYLQSHVFCLCNCTYIFFKVHPLYRHNCPCILIGCVVVWFMQIPSCWWGSDLTGMSLTSCSPSDHVGPALNFHTSLHDRWCI